MPKIHAGTGRISLSRYGPDAVFSELSSTYPLKLLSPRITHAGVALVYLMTYGGGLVSGDQVTLSVDVSLGATLVLLSQVSSVYITRITIYRRRTRDQPRSSKLDQACVSIQ